MGEMGLKRGPEESFSPPNQDNRCVRGWLSWVQQGVDNAKAVALTPHGAVHFGLVGSFQLRTVCIL